MEEYVGQLWHKLITRAASREHLEAAVTLEEVRLPVTLMFRALGGDGGLRLEAANETAHGGRRSFLSRIAGSNQNVELAWRDEETLRLPMRIAWFNSSELNRDLYLWLAALAAHSPTANDGKYWLQSNARAVKSVLEDYPGLAASYRRLLAAHLEQRPPLEGLPESLIPWEREVRRALQDPAQTLTEYQGATRPDPVILWLHPCPPAPKAEQKVSRDADSGDAGGGDSEEVNSDKRRRGERVDEPDGKGGLMAFRLESLFTRAEYAAVDRTQEENEDEDAKSAVEDLDVISMSRQRNTSASRLRFDLDLPSQEYDDPIIADGISLPEWDFGKQRLLPDHCRLQLMIPRDSTDGELPAHLRYQARRLRNLFELLKPRRSWYNQQSEGPELDGHALIQQATDRIQGSASSDACLYRNFHNKDRDLSCLVLADLSLSTDAHVDDEQKVIDVVRDSLHLFAEALVGTGDRFALYGFSSRHRDHVRFHELKAFEQAHGDDTRARINAIKPGYYTRMGAAIRYASRLLEKEASSQKLLLILTDGKPNDLDKYEGRYGVEDTRHALQEIEKKGIEPFCVTIDKKAGDYLPYLFGSNSYVLVRRARELPQKLPMLYARLTAS